jgi:hypothetical protein
MKLSDYLNAINHTKVAMDKLDDDYEYVLKKYVPFIINKGMSYFPESIIQSNNMNFFCGIDKRMHFDYLQRSIRKRKRFCKWMKKTKPSDLQAIKDYFGYSNGKAYEALDILSKEQINNIKEELNMGGS